MQDVNVTVGSDWLTILSGSSGTNTGNVIIQFDENASLESRTGTIEITSSEAGNSPIEVTVYQYGANMLNGPQIVSCDPETATWSNDNEINIAWEEPSFDGINLLRENENVEKIQNNISRSVQGYCWSWDHLSQNNPGEDFCTNVLSTTSSPLADSNDWYFHIKAQGDNDNWGEITNYGPFYIDCTSPNGSISINDNSTSTESIIVDINLYIEDETSGNNQMRFSNDGNTWSNWEAFSSSKTNWDLTTFGGNINEGTKTVYCEVNDIAGNVVQIEDDIILDIIDFVADFQADQTEITLGDTIQFLDLSSGNPTIWEWDFENDGEIDSYEPNPNYCYPSAGTYSVSLTAGELIIGGGWFDTELKVDYITVNELPTYNVHNITQDTWYETIQAGIDNSVDNDIIIVNPDTYYENINFNGKGITLRSLFYTTQDTSYISQTVIDGSQSGSVVRFESDEDSTCVLQGFTITNGGGNVGGGIYCYGSSPTLKNLIITENCVDDWDLWFDGAGIYCENSSPFLYQVEISHNSGDWHGALHCISSNPVLDEVTFEQNDGIYGGGISLIDNSDVVISNSTIINNNQGIIAGNAGGGIYCNESSITITNSIVSGNRTGGLDGGGGIALLSNSNAHIENVTISENNGNIGGGILCYGSALELINSDIRENSSQAGGGILASENSILNIVNVIISGNNANDGGGMHLFDTELEITNSFIMNNTSNSGGGIEGYGSSMIADHVIIAYNSSNTCGGIMSWNSDFLLTNSTLFNNNSDSEGAICCRNSNAMNIVNSIIYDNYPVQISFSDQGNPNELNIAFSDVEGGESSIITNNNGISNWLEGSIDADPLFAFTDSLDFNLLPDSPCIDAGASYFEYSGEVLIDINEDEYIGSAPDMGAYESEYNAFYAEFSADSTEVYVNQEIQFTDLSVGNITNWAWDFQNDGIIDSNEPNPVYAYPDSGEYSVSLIIQDVYGNTDTIVKENYITVIEGSNTHGLIAYYPFNGNANDESGNGNDGDVNGSILAVDRFGNVNSAYEFDGVDDYINTNYYPTIENDSSYSISLWMKSNELEGNDSNEHLLSLELGAAQEIAVLNNEIAQDVRFYLRDDEGNNSFCSCVEALGDNLWHQIVAVRDISVDSITIYVDDIKYGSAVDNTTTGINITNSKWMAIGCNNHNESLSDFYTGYLDDIGFYNYTLTENEIRDLYQEGGWPNSSITITNPNSSTIWYQGEGFSIDWTGATGSEVQFLIFKDGLELGICHEWTSNDGNCNGYMINPSWGTGSGYQLKAIDTDGNYGWSDEFTIDDGSTIIVTNPNSSTVWYQGSDFEIDWSGSSGNQIQVMLYNNGNEIGICHDWTANDGICHGLLVASWGTGSGYQVKVVDDDGEFGWSEEFHIDEESDFEFCYVEAGEYTWGENDVIQSINYDYRMMKYEVTNSQYRDYLESALEDSLVWIQNGDIYGHYYGDEYFDEGDYAYYDLDSDDSMINWDGNSFTVNEEYFEHPVVEVNWFGAKAFTKYYNLQLPIEQEWEKATRGLSGFDFPWGDDLTGDRANYYNSGDPWENGITTGTTPVGFYNGQQYEGFQTVDTPSPYNCYDVCGNVFEWTDSVNPDDISQVFKRGGSWNSSYGHLLSHFRYSQDRFGTGPNLGFRCVKKNSPPDIPCNPIPETGSFEEEINLELSWECSDPDGDELFYSLYMGNSEVLNETNLITEAIIETSYQLNSLEFNTPYYWKVVASDGEFETESEIWSFVTTIGTIEDNWALVEAGPFTFGQNNEMLTIEYDYEIMKYEVTNAQYRDFLESASSDSLIWIQEDYVYGHYEGDEHYPAGDYIFYDLGSPDSYNYGQIDFVNDSYIINVPSGYQAGDFDNHPVVEVSWFGAYAFADYYDLRLPTEQEWEKAARGDTGNDYPWGNELSSSWANYSISGDPWDEGTSSCGYYNGYGDTENSHSIYNCYDMCGNVFDWTDSWYGGSYYNRRVLRGGSWCPASTNDYLLSWYRANGSPDGPAYMSNYLGFRCVRDEDIEINFNLPNQIEFDEDIEFVMDLTEFIQYDNIEELTASQTSSGNIFVTFDGLVATFEAVTDWYGEEVVHIQVSSNSNRVAAEDSLLVIVLPVNDPPEISVPLADLGINEDAISDIINLNDHFTDVDGDELQYSIYVSEENAVFNMEDNMLSVSAIDNWSGDYYVIVSASDDINRFTINDTFAVTILPVNDIPVIDLPDFFTFNEDEIYTEDFSQYISDVDGDSLALSVNGNQNIDVEFLDDYQVLFIPQENWYGTEMMIFTVDDGVERATASDSVNVIVNEVINVITADFEANITVACTGDTIYFTDLSTSIDDPITSWAWDFQNDGIIDSNEPNPLCVYNEEGLYSVSLTVADDYGRESDTLIKDDYITIASYDPVLNLPEEFTFNEDESSEFDLMEYIEYEPIEELQVSWSGNDQILIESDGLILDFSANLNWFGQELVTIYVSNGTYRNVVSDSILVIVEPVNDPPILNIPNDFEFNEDTIATYDLSNFCQQTWGENDELYLSAENTEHLNLTINDYFLTIESNTENWNGSEEIVLYLNENVSPEINLPERIYIAEDCTTIEDFSVYIEDPDNDNHLITEDGNDHIDIEIIGYIIEFTPEQNWFGSEIVTFTVNDQLGRSIASDDVIISTDDIPWIENNVIRNNLENYRLQVSQTIDVNVIPINDIPQINLPENLILEEDSTGILDFSLYISDVDGDYLALSVNGNQYIDVAFVEGYFVEFFPQENWYGTEMMIFTVDDGVERATASDSVNVIVNEVINVITADFEANVTVACTGDTIYFTDLSTSIDDPITSWAWDFQNDGIIDSNEPNPLCVYIEEGLYSVSLTVADDYGRESDTLIKDDYITIASYDPVLNLPEEFTFNEDESSELDLEEYIEYEPIEELQVIWSGNDQIHIESEGLVLYFSANLNWFGQEQVTIYLSNEASRSIVSDSIIVIVEPVNDAPMISIPDTLSFIGNKIFDFGELDYVSDVDGDMLDLSYSGNENISVSIEGLLVSFESNGWYGSENIVFAVNDNVQRTAALDTVLVIAYPNWSVNPPDYEYSASIWGIVLLDDIEVDVTSGMLSCFVGEECRGIASFDDGSIIDYNEYFGHIIFLPMIYSNVTSGETIDFLYFDAETVGIYQVAESIDFVADVVVGDGYDPFVFHASTVSTIDISKAMIPGWNWFSLNVTGEDMSTNSVLASIGTNASNIKNQTQSAMYYPGPGWLGSLNTINNITFYKLSVNNPDTLEYSGMPVEISEITYDLTAGWNWISYAPQAAENINYALATLDDGSNIKSQTQSAMYYPGPGWLGSLTTLQPLDGYMLNMNAPDQLIYPEPEPAVRSFADISEFKVESAGWSVNPHEYEFNGVVNAEIVGESQIDPVDYELAVFCGDECRGIAEVLDYTQLFGGVYHSVMVYSNELAGDEMRVVLYDKASADILETDIYFTFIADMVSGDFIDPVQIMLPGDETKIITATRLVSCYPNPFNPETNISFELAGDEMVRIEVYNIKGQKVATVLEQEMTAGAHSIVWNAQGQNSGIFFLRFEADGECDVKKVILLK